ncbi:MAG TPA: hypothetical protein VHI99_22800 [Vicinamibacterales bacterium]|nr:hypothetical protein [Vicinamibacterales bacterium]
MKCWTTHWTTAIAAAALFALPTSARAQATATPQTPASAVAQQAQQPATPDDHLRQAESALNSISPTAVTGKAKTRIAELKQHLNALESASASGAANPGTKGGDEKWSSEVAAMDRILTDLLGPDSTTGASGTPGATGTTGSTDAVTIDAETRGKLTEVRRQLTAFAASKSGTAPSDAAASPDAAATAAAAATAMEPTSAATQPQRTPAAQPSSSTTASEPAAQAPQQAATQPSQAAQPSQDEARRHLTMARDSLSQLTQLPAASQLAGETRAQVSQLITNFNELITTSTEWKASYSKVDANLTALLGAPAGDEPPPAAAAPTGTPGAVGTSGATTLDPAIRAKLIEFRAHLKDFEKAAGGASAAAAANAPSPTTAAPSPGPAAASAATAATAAPEPAAASSDQASSEDAARHIQAIETILSSSPADAPLTLDKTQVEQLRLHLTLLKKIVDKK